MCFHAVYLLRESIRYLVSFKRQNVFLSFYLFFFWPVGWIFIIFGGGKPIFPRVKNLIFIFILFFH